MTTQENTVETKTTEVKNIAFAQDETTVHVALGDAAVIDGQKFTPVESLILLPGDYIEMDRLPDYLQASIKAKKTPTLKLVTLDEAIKLKEERERILMLLGDQVSGSSRVPSLDEE